MSKFQSLGGGTGLPKSPRRKIPASNGKMATGASNGAVTRGTNSVGGFGTGMVAGSTLGLAATPVMSTRPYSGQPSDSVTMSSTDSSVRHPHKETVHMKEKHVEKASVSMSETEKPYHDKNAEKHKDKHSESSWGWSAVVWIIVFFVIILFIVMAVFWAFQPDCVTRKGEEDECELDLARAALYAFVIAFFFVFVIAAVWYCAMR